MRCCRYRAALLAWLMVVTAVLIAGCGTAPASSAGPTGSTSCAPEVAAGASAPAATLTLRGPSGTKTVTLADVEGLGAFSGYGGYTCPPHPGITGPTHYTGVELANLLDLVGGMRPDSVVSVAASDRYVMTFTAKQIRDGDFVTYDPKTAVKKAVEKSPRVVLAYQTGGKALSKDEGPFRLVTLTAGPTQLVEGFLWVKWVERIQIRSATDDWTLHLAGPTEFALDRSAFVKLATDARYHTEWEDIQGRTWTGTPLYVLAGLAGAQAETGYTVQLTGADRSSSVLESAKIESNPGFLVANQMEGNPLGDVYFPVSLVGKSLGTAQWIAGITEIRVTTPTPDGQ